MSVSRGLQVAVPATDVPDGGEPFFRRVLIPERSAGHTRRRRPAISRIVLGSVGDQVMRMATCPVLTVQPKRK